MIALVALLGLGALTVLTVRVESQSSGQGRYDQQALYVAESGAYAGIDFLRSNCETENLFTQWLSKSNASPQEPTGILGNNVKPGQTGNPFGTDNTTLWYSVKILNNSDDPCIDGSTTLSDCRGGARLDSDGIVVLESTGHGPDQSVATVKVTASNNTCLNAFCAQEYAQRDVGERNTSSVACSARIASGTLRTVNP
jgi:hypothetical protein